MNFFNAIVIGFVQGVGEFLPISSSGHLVLLYQLFHISDNNVVISIFLHLATLFSVIYVYRKEIIELIKNPLCKTNKLLITATIPTVILALILKGLITASFDGNFVIFGFLITAVLLGFADYLSESQYMEAKAMILSPNTSTSPCNQYTFTITSEKEIICSKPHILQQSKSSIINLNLTFKQAFIIGISQGIACFPGISRSGTTIAAGLIMKGDKNEVTTFSFLLSIPIIIGSLIMAVFDLNSSTSRINTISLITSCLISFLVGIVSIGLINKIVKKKQLSYFSFYLIGLVFVILLIKFIV